MRFDVITLFPDALRAMVEIGVTGRALQGQSAQLRTWNPRDYANDRHHTVDDRPYGGGPGMVMTVEPLRRTIQAVRAAAPGVPGVLAQSPGTPVAPRRGSGVGAATRHDIALWALRGH